MRTAITPSVPPVPPEQSVVSLSDEQITALASALRLSPRETEILRCLLRDEGRAAIAETLGISSHTVHAYLGRLYRKVNVRSRSQFIVRVFAELLCLPGTESAPPSGMKGATTAQAIPKQATPERATAARATPTQATPKRATLRRKR